MLETHVLADIGQALAWPALYATLFGVVFLALLAEAINVALFAGDKRGERALKIIRELVQLFRRRPR